MDIITNINIKNDLMDILRLFNYDGVIELNADFSDGILSTDIIYKGRHICFKDNIENCGDTIFKRLEKRFCKTHLYEVLKKDTGIILPWGSLTGIRPVRLYNQMCGEIGEYEAENYFLNFFDVSKEKTSLVKEISSVQKKYYDIKKNSADLYVGIPFCRGRCSYCSFFSADIDKNKELIDIYTQNLIREIKCVKQIINQKDYVINSIYVGGGTPSSLPSKNLKVILNELADLKVLEFTVEAGRPDSINIELLDVLKNNKVSRISINPQSVKDETLKIIGRRHTFEDCLRAYDLSKKYEFSVNMDIIAGLPEEDLNDFINTVNKVSELKPQNITVHTLAIKHGSDLKIKSYRHKEDNIEKMLGFADEKLHSQGYNAYYLYKQKNAAGNLENTGYSLAGFECRYNIDNMEDNVNIIACGANSISKRIFDLGRIERQANPKDIKTYCDKNGDLCLQKKSFF